LIAFRKHPSRLHVPGAEQLSAARPCEVVLALSGQAGFAEIGSRSPPTKIEMGAQARFEVGAFARMIDDIDDGVIKDVTTAAAFRGARVFSKSSVSVGISAASASL
jgi:hypothetical protein